MTIKIWPSEPLQEMFCKEYSSWRGCSTALLTAITFKLHFTPAFNTCLLLKLSNKLSSNYIARCSTMALDVSTKCNGNQHLYFLLNQKLNSTFTEFQRLTRMFFVYQVTTREIEFLYIPRLSSWLYPSTFYNKLCIFLFPQKQKVMVLILAGEVTVCLYPKSTHLSSTPSLNKRTAALWQ